MVRNISVYQKGTCEHVIDFFIRVPEIYLDGSSVDIHIFAKNCVILKCSQLHIKYEDIFWKYAD